MKNKLVSIVIPTYNRVDLIEETVNSALAQSYDHFEVVVLDNNSSDGSFDFLQEKYGDNDRVQLHLNTETLDIVKNWRKCFDYAKGDYVLILWSDDLIDPDFLSKTVGFLEANPQAGFVYTRTEIFNKDAGFSKSAFVLNQTGLIEKDVFIEKSLLEPPLSVPVSPANSLFRRQDLDESLLTEIPNKLGITYSKIGQGNDNLIFLLALNNYTHFGYIDECLSHFRDHRTSLTLSTNSMLVTIHYHIAKAYFVDNYLKNPSLLRRFNSKIVFLKLVAGIQGVKKYPFSRENLYTKNTSTAYNPLLVLNFFFKYLQYKIKNRLDQRNAG